MFSVVGYNCRAYFLPDEFQRLELQYFNVMNLLFCLFCVLTKYFVLLKIKGFSFLFRFVFFSLFFFLLSLEILSVYGT